MPPLDLRRGIGDSLEDNDASELLREMLAGRSLRAPCSRAPSNSLPLRISVLGMGACFALASSTLARWKASNNELTWAKYVLNADDSTCGIFVSVTGGMSRVVGGFDDVGAAACGRSPVRTIGGCNNVEIAVRVLIPAFARHDT